MTLWLWTLLCILCFVVLSTGAVALLTEGLVTKGHGEHRKPGRASWVDDWKPQEEQTPYDDDYYRALSEERHNLVAYAERDAELTLQMYEAHSQQEPVHMSPYSQVDTEMIERLNSDTQVWKVVRPDEGASPDRGV